MKSLQAFTNLLDKPLNEKPSRFDMAINFYCCIKKNNKYFLVAYYYNPAWNLYYPFYDDINKTPVLSESTSLTYQDLMKEVSSYFDSSIKTKLNLAHQRFKELIGCECEVKKVNETYELKHSKTANLYTIYKFYNFVITDVDDIKTILNPVKLKCELFDISNLDENKVVGNAIDFCNENMDLLKKYAIVM